MISKDRATPAGMKILGAAGAAGLNYAFEQRTIGSAVRRRCKSLKVRLGGTANKDAKPGLFGGPYQCRGAPQGRQSYIQIHIGTSKDLGDKRSAERRPTEDIFLGRKTERRLRRKHSMSFGGATLRKERGEANSDRRQRIRGGLLG